MEHSALVVEMGHVEKMSTAERLKHARKRRAQQLKNYHSHEKSVEKESRKRRTGGSKSSQMNSKIPRVHKVQFVSNVMLLEAAARNDIEEVRYLLMEGVSPDVTNEDGLTALHQCCIDELESMMRLLIEFNANVNAQDSELWTPLHAAATCGHVQLCRILVDNGGLLLAVNADGNMPYDICDDEQTLDFIESEMAKRGVTQELIDDTRLSTEKTFLEDVQERARTGQDLEFRGRNGETPLHIAAANGYIQVTELLLDNHVAVDAVDDDLWQPIHCAACWGQLAVLELLLLHGGTLDAKTRGGETPLDICEDHDMKQRLLEMKDELESHRATKSTDLTRRRSQNTRSSTISTSSVSSLYNSNTSVAATSGPTDKHHSASVRRTSMREKSALSWKEAREEAQRMRQAPGAEDEEDVTPTPSPLSPDFVPTTNIDDVHVALDEDDKAQTWSNVSIESAPHQPHKNPAPQPPNLDRAKNGVASDNNMNRVPAHHAPQPIVPQPTNPQPTNPQPTNPQPQPTDHHEDHSPPKSPQNDTTPPPGRKNSTSSLGMPPTGTLADLKKQRQQKLQEAMKQHSMTFGDNISSQSSHASSNGHMESTSKTPNGVRTSQGSSMRKYSSSQEIFGASDDNTNCCTIL